MTKLIGDTFASEIASAGLAGIITSWRDDGTILYPADVTDEVRAKAEAVLAAHDPMKSGPAAPYGILKTDVVSRMSDAELDRFDAALTSAPTRARRMWTDCHEIQSDSPFFAGLQQQFTTAFGADRATAILAASTI